MHASTNLFERASHDGAQKIPEPVCQMVHFLHFKTPAGLRSHSLIYSEYSVYTELYEPSPENQGRKRPAPNSAPDMGFLQPSPSPNRYHYSSFSGGCRCMSRTLSFEKGKPAERLGRKATGLHPGRNRDTAAGLPGDGRIPPWSAGAELLPTSAAPKPASLHAFHHQPAADALSQIFFSDDILLG